MIHRKKRKTPRYSTRSVSDLSFDKTTICRSSGRLRSPYCIFIILFVFVVNPIQLEKIIGSWDLTINGADGSYPSWLEVARAGDRLNGRFVGRWGAVQPVKNIRFDGERIDFALDRAENDWPHDLIFNGKLSDGRLSGTTHWSGEEQRWTASRAPALKNTGAPIWSKPISLFNGTDLAGWRSFPATKPSQWKIENGALFNAASGANLVTEQKFSDFQLHFEFKIDAGSDSGVYLRGRYEIEIEDSFGKAPDSHRMGGIYGFLTPASNPARRANEWQTIDATLVGRKVTISLNGTTIIDNDEIPGITGAALDSDEGTPGPLMLQGDYGKVWYRKIVLTPAK
jgi:3-keto-disaccharide hydrolase